MRSVFVATLALFLSSTALCAPTGSTLDAKTFLQNGQDAQALNAEFATLEASDACDDGEMACINSSIAHCVNTTWQLQACSSSLSCFALPSVREQGVVLSCTSNATALSVINASGATGGVAANSTNTSVELPIDCNGDDESDDDTQSSSPSNSTSASTSAHATHTESSQATTTVINSTGDAGPATTVTVTVAPASTLPSETFTLNPSQAASLLSSLAANPNVSITTILPSSVSTVSAVSAAVTGTASSESDVPPNSATTLSGKPVGVASVPSGSSSTVLVSPTTITLLAQVASPRSTTGAPSSTAVPDGGYYGSY